MSDNFGGIERGPLPRRNFTVIDNPTINDERLTFRATGVLIYLLAKPPGWRINAGELARRKREGRAAVLAALKELELCGYLVRTKTRGSDGRFLHKQTIYDTPQPPAQESPGHTRVQEPDPGFPYPGFPTPVSRTLSTKNYEQILIRESDILPVHNSTDDETLACPECDDDATVLLEDGTWAACPAGCVRSVSKPSDPIRAHK